MRRHFASPINDESLNASISLMSPQISKDSKLRRKRLSLVTICHTNESENELNFSKPSPKKRIERKSVLSSTNSSRHPWKNKKNKIKRKARNLWPVWSKDFCESKLNSIKGVLQSYIKAINLMEEKRRSIEPQRHLALL